MTFTPVNKANFYAASSTAAAIVSRQHYFTASNLFGLGTGSLEVSIRAAGKHNLSATPTTPVKTNNKNQDKYLTATETNDY